jgi:hypothetical protein
MVFHIAPRITWQTSSWDGYLIAKQEASISYNAAIGLNAATHTRQFVSAELTYQRSLVPGFLFEATAAGVYSIYADLYSEIRPAAQGATLPVTPIVSASFQAYHYAGARVGIEKYIYKWKYGTLAFLLNYQILGSFLPELNWRFDHGFGAGVSFYMSRLAIPALQVLHNYNIQRNNFSVAFAVGISL